MEELLCPYCETELEEEANFCPTCGADVTEYIRQIKIDRQKQLSSAGNVVQDNRDDEDDNRIILKRFLTAFVCTLVVSVIGIIVLMLGGLV